MSLLSEGVQNGEISCNRMVEVASTNPAKLFGCYPQKGTIAPGSDADIVVWDPEAEYTWSTDRTHSAIDYTCFDGMKVRGAATHVLSRGEVMIEDGELTDAATPGRGRFVHRRTFEYDRPGEYNNRGASEAPRVAVTQ